MRHPPENATRRFSDRAADYLAYRPRYPAQVLTFLRRLTGLGRHTVVADIGSGTGFLTERLLQTGARVISVEPNDEMRRAAEASLAGSPGFSSLAGRSEATGLPDKSVDLITAAQAFHWFDLKPTAIEFRRILRPGGWLAVIWNNRDDASSPFMAAYDSFVRDWADDYTSTEHRQVDLPSLKVFLGSDGVTLSVCSNHQEFDFKGLRGRLLSSLYAPGPGHPRYDDMIVALRRLFEAHDTGGRVRFDYRTEIFCGQFGD